MHVDVYEPIGFFKDRLAENLAEFEGRFRIIDDYRVLPPSRSYDLVIVDGGNTKSDDSREGFDDAVYLYLRYLREVKFVYVEGKRYLQRYLARTALRERYRYRLTRFGRTEYEGKVLNGGVLIACTPCSSRIVRWMNFMFWEIIEWKGLRNALRRTHAV